MSDRIAFLNDGKLQQIAPPAVAYSQPANQFVASFIGSPSMNFADATVENGTIQTGGFSLPAPDDVTGPVSTLGIRPENINISEGSPQFTATVRVFEQVGSFNMVHLEIDGVDENIIAQVPGAKHYDFGATVEVSIDTSRIHLFGEDGETVHNPEVYTS